jgi:hypothetical protein
MRSLPDQHTLGTQLHCENGRSQLKNFASIVFSFSSNKKLKHKFLSGLGVITDFGNFLAMDSGKKRRSP